MNKNKQIGIGKVCPNCMGKFVCKTNKKVGITIINCENYPKKCNQSWKVKV